MDAETENPTIEEQLQERFLALPKSLQDAITSADIDKRLRELSEKQKLHLDQWQKLENEVMLTLMGLEEAENLEENIRKEVALPDEDASALATDIARTIFQPVREELERETDTQEPWEKVAPEDASAKTDDGGQQTTEKPNERPADKGSESLAQAGLPAQAGQKLLTPPSTPPATPPSEKSVRATFSH